MTARRVRRRRTQAERRAETRAAVLESACRLFGSKGYAGTSLEEIAAAAGVTIRPVYHYFGGKRQLFEAVNAVMEERILAALEASAESASEDPVVSAWRAFLELCRDPEFRRVALVDAPGVLGRDRWETSAVTRAARQMLEGSGRRAGVRSALAARVLVGALAEAGVAIAESDDPDAASREADPIVTRMVRALLVKEET